MERAFVDLRSRGPAWDDSKPLEQQAEWGSHAAFMDGLLRASGASEIVERLAADPWTGTGLLVTKQISLWQIRLGTLE